jgi:AcrR family transcriptional regulator
MFAARGFEQTTVRAVAAEAGIDASMVMRYFGSKAGLFAAASTTHLQVPDLGPVPRSRRGEYMVRHFVDRWEHDPDDETLVFLMRTAVTNADVARQLQTTFNDLIKQPIVALGFVDADRRAGLIGTQLLGLALCRYILHLDPIAAAAAEDVITDIGPAVQLHLELSSG